MIKYYFILDDIGGGGGGGDNKLPDPPKNYTPLTVQNRADWNGFLDYAGKQNIDFDKNPQAAANLMSQYKKTNPNFSITPDQIQNIQYEQYQLRKGDKFGSLGPEQLKYLRQGFNPNYLNKPVPDANGQFNSATSKLYYPQVGSYGTDVESYVNGITKQQVATNTPTKTVKSAAPTAQNSPTVNDVSPAGVTRPNYNDPRSRANYLQGLASQPGNSFVHGRGDTIVRINEVPVYGNISAKQSAIQEAKKQGLDPALLYSSTMEEGANGLYPDKNGEISGGEGTSDKYPVSRYGNYGLDNFHGDFKDMVKKGYLPKDFDYEPSYHTNENGDKVPSANFKNTEDAMAAKAAYVHFYQDKLDDYTKQQEIKLSPTARQFFTLIGFNGGPGTAHKLIKYYNSKGLLDGDKFMNVDPGKDVDPGGAWGHIVPRFQMANLLRKEKYF